MKLFRSPPGICLTVLAAALAACGGGGGGGSSTSTPPPVQIVDLSLSGTAATGKAIAGATLNAKCQTGTGTATTTATGTYTIKISGGVLPCVLQVTNPLDSTKLHSVAVGTANSAVANLTPLSDMVVARLLRQDPAVYFAAFNSSAVAGLVTSSAITTAQNDVVATLTGVVDPSTVSSFVSGPLTAATAANPTGGDAHDKVLDALRLKFTPAQIGQVVTSLASSANIATVKDVVANIVAVPPVANAGPDQNVSTGTVVTLDGSTSSTEAGRSLTYAWTLTAKPSGSNASLASATSAKPTITPDVAGTYTVSLVVNDGRVSSSADAINVVASVANSAPVANAGVAQNVKVMDYVVLDGSASSDANGDMLTYSWSFVSVPVGSPLQPFYSGQDTVRASFTTVVPGSYVARLVVNDGKVSSIPSTVTITATATNAAPVANAGVAQRAAIGSTIALDGSASSDANSDPLTYAWTLTSKPTGSTAALSSTITAKPTFTADVAGMYVVSLVVNDGKLSSTSVSNTITGVTRIVGALGIATTQFSTSSFCNINGPMQIGLWTWTISNCGVFGTAGAPLFARIQNNGSTALTLTKIAVLAGYFGNAWNIDPASQTINPGSTVDFALPLWLSLEVTNAMATFSLTGEPDLVVQLKGSMTLP